MYWYCYLPAEGSGMVLILQYVALYWCFFAYLFNTTALQYGTYLWYRKVEYSTILYSTGTSSTTTIHVLAAGTKKQNHLTRLACRLPATHRPTVVVPMKTVVVFLWWLLLLLLLLLLFFSFRRLDHTRRP